MSGPEGAGCLADKKGLACFCTHIPLCGGFCAVTINPEPSTLRQFSNEWTLPQPCLRPKACRLVTEHNVVCRFIGKMGIGTLDIVDSNRKRLMVTAGVISIVAWFMTLYALLGLSKTAATLKNVAWAKGEVHNETIRVEAWMGIQAVLVNYEVRASATDTWKVVEEGVKGWKDDACDTALPGNAQYCNKCADAAGSCDMLVITGILTQIVQICTDFQRSTRFGDMNCQKTMAIITGLYGCFSTLLTLRVFRDSCWKSLPTVGPNGETMSWSAGPGFVCLWVATVLKLVDVLLHIILPTPPWKFEPVPGDTFADDLEDYMGNNDASDARLGRHEGEMGGIKAT